MTVMDASIKLYEWFLEHDSFSDTGKDFVSLMEISDTPDEDKAAYYCALKELEEQKMVSFHEKEEQRIWVLQRDLQQCDQEVKVNYLTAMQVAHVVNTFCEVMNNKQNKCNPAQISEEDIRSLIFINQTLSGENGDEDKSIDQLLPPIN